ncbi:sodium channel protein 1 brain-like isoform X5 [Clytia hemisphaerica]|uniref:sodium channel protein 1 brain-like isoform X5 n=1 Tax=Clytia hemisphaerica TaxID=252671 RepID=UPI0034D59DC1
MIFKAGKVFRENGFLPHTNNQDMEPGLWGRTIHKDRARSKSPRPGSGSRSRSRGARDSVLDGDYYPDDETISDGYRSDESEEELDEYINVPNCMLGQPLKDFDSGQENTFVVVNKKFGKQVVYRFCKEKSLWLFGTQNPLRKVNIYIFTHQYFEIFILLTIAVNCVFMALSDPPELMEFIFAAIYTLEMIIKILAKGFVMHKYSYLRNSWNWLDFVVVVLGYVTMTPWVNNLDGFRTFRVLRALKTISTVKGLKAMVNTLLKSMKMMTDVIILTLFFISIFALIGLQLFPGQLRSRCVKGRGNLSIFEDDYYKKKENWAFKQNTEEEIICGNASTAWNCPDNYTCIPGIGENPGRGYVSYDSFPQAFLTSLQVCTLDYWEIVFNSVISAMGEWYMIYFLLAVFLGPFYLLNLVLAVVSASYEMEINGNPDPEIELEKLNRVKRTASTYSFDGEHYVEFLEGPSPVEEIDGNKRYTVPVEQKKKPKAKKEEINYSLPPVLGDNPTFSLRCRAFFFKFVSSTAFEGIIIGCIAINTAFMASEHYDMDTTYKYFLEICNYVFTTMFAIEMVMKILGYTLKGYLKNKWNMFDGTLVIVSIIDILLSTTGLVDGNVLSFLKVFRLMRVMKLAKSWKTMGQLLSTIAGSMGALGNVTVILGLIIYIFSVMGMQIFGSLYDKTKYKPCDPDGEEFPRYNFENFGNSFMMIFRILCGKWIEPQWDLLDLTNIASIFFIFLVFVIGRWVVLNLFLALLLSSFAGLNETSDEEDEEPKMTRIQKIIEWSKKIRKKKNKANFNDMDENDEKKDLGDGENGNLDTKNLADGNIPDMHVEIYGKDGMLMVDSNGNEPKMTEVNSDIDNNLKPILNNHDSDISKLQNGTTISNGDVSRRRLSGSVDIEIPVSVAPTEGFSNGGLDNGMGKKENSLSSVKIEIQREKTYIDDCLCSFCYACSCCNTSYLESPLRRFWHNSRHNMKMLIEHKYFEAVILFLIAFSSLTLVFEDVYLNEKEGLKDFLFYCNYFFAIIFTLEFLVKLFALGFVTYFTNFWNLLDVFIVAISLSSLFGDSGGNLKALRSLRGLRPLRAISRFEGMKVVVNALVYSIPSIGNVLLVCVAFWLIFSIMGYNLFGGKFSRCLDENFKQLNISWVNNKTQCFDRIREGYNYTWKNRNINFDDAASGFLALFQTATLEGWFEAMADAYDARNIDEQPGYRVSYFNQMYFVVFILLGAFFILNLFIGVIIDNFNRLKQQYEDGADGVSFFLTPGQRNWINTLKAASLKKPSRRLTRPKSKWRGTLFDFIQTKYFEFFIMSVILLNMLSMMIQHYNQPREVDLALDYLNYVFTGIFTIEAILRLTAMRLEYFKYGMNVFDFIIVVFSIAAIVMDAYNQNFIISPGLFRVVRVFRLGRLLRFFEGAKGIRKLLFTIVKSAPALSNIGTLLFLITFIYAIMGMNLFGTIAENGAITQTTNFKTFGASMCVLFRISTAAGWNAVLEGAMVQPPSCDPNMQGNCGNKLIAIIFFVTYIMVIVLIIINMYIAVILENFNQAQSQDEAGITEDDLEAYYATWEEFDPKATQFIKYSQLSDFIDALDGPLKVPKPNYWFLEQTDIPIKERYRCHCLDIMTALIKRALGDESCEESEDLSIILKKVEDRYKKLFPLRTKENDVETTRERLKTENAAAKSIQRVFRRHLLMDEINLISNAKNNIGLRARDKTINKIEQLVTVMWKTQKNNGANDDEEEEDENEEIESGEENEVFEDDFVPLQPGGGGGVSIAVPTSTGGGGASGDENGVIENTQADMA